MSPTLNSVETYPKSHDSAPHQGRPVLPIELLRLIVLNLKALGWDRTLSKVAGTSKSIYELVTPILYSSLTLTCTNAKKVPPRFWCDHAEDLDYEDQTDIQMWLIKAALDDLVTRWESPLSIMNKMLNASSKSERDLADWIVSEDREGCRWMRATKIREAGRYELKELSPAVTRMLRPLIANSVGISNWRHLQSLSIASYPRFEEDLRECGSFCSDIGSTLQHRVMPKLKSICFVEDHPRIMEVFTAELPWQLFNLESKYKNEHEVAEVLDERKETLAKFFGHLGPRSGIAVCQHTTTKKQEDIPSGIVPFVENMKGITSITLHGRQENVGPIYDEPDDPYIRIFFGELGDHIYVLPDGKLMLDAPHLSPLTTIPRYESDFWIREMRSLAEHFAELIGFSDNWSFPFSKPNTTGGSDHTQEKRIHIIADQGSETVMNVAATWTDILESRIDEWPLDERAGVGKEMRAAALALLSITDVTRTDAEDLAYLCRPCDACGDEHFIFEVAECH